MPRTLVIDDEQVNREFLLLALRPYGPCLAAGTAKQGLDELRRALAAGEPFDLVFLDLMLPGMNGLQALELLRAAEDAHGQVRAHVIVTTALDDDRAAARAFLGGQAASYMVKPFRAVDVVDELQKLGFLARGEPRREP